MNEETSKQSTPLEAKTKRQSGRRNTRGQDARVMKIHRILNGLREGRFIIGNELANRCGVTRRQIVDDIAHMRDDLLLPILDDHRGYAYEEHVDFVPHLLLSQQLCYTLLLAVKSVGGYRTEHQKSALRRIFNRISAALGENGDLDIDEMDRCLSFGTMLTPRHDPGLIDFVWRAASERIELKMLYGTPGKVPTERVIHVLEVHKLRREWIAFCRDSKRPGDVRFSLGRMKNVTTTGKTFVRPEFDREKTQAGALDVYTGPEMMDIIVHVTKEKAHFIHEYKIGGEVAWKEVPDGAMEVHLRLSSFVDLLDLLRGDLRGAAIPLHPRALVEEWRCDAKKDLAAAEAVLAGAFRKEHAFIEELKHKA